MSIKSAQVCITTCILLFCVAHAANTIRLGLLMPVTPSPNGTQYGRLWTHIAIAAASYINKQQFLLNNYTLDLRVYDTFDTPAGTISAAIRSTINDNCVGVIGTPHSQLSELVQYVLQNYGVPQVSPLSTAYELSNKAVFPTFLRTIPTDIQAGLAIARVVAYYKWKRVGVIMGADSYSLSLYNAFSIAIASYNISIVAPIVIDAIQPNYEEQVTRLKNAYTQINILFGETDDIENVLLEAYKQEIIGGKYVWIGADAMLTINNSILPLDILNGNLIISPSSIANTSLAQQYLSEMSNMNTSHLLGGFIYDAVYTFAHAFNDMLQIAPTLPPPWVNRTLFLNTLLDVNFSGVSGTVQFDSLGDRLDFTYELLNFQKGGELEQVATMDSDGVITNVSSVIWPDGTTRVPVDYIMIIRPAPREEIKQTFFILTIILFSVLGTLTFIFVVMLISTQSIPKTRYLVLHLSKIIGSGLGYSAILVIVGGVSKLHCTLAPILADLSFLMCGGIIALNAAQKFVAEYSDFSRAKYASAKTVARILYSILIILVALNVAVLVGTFVYKHPSTQLYVLEGNVYERRCKFSFASLVAFPISISLIFIYSLFTTFLKVFVNVAVATKKIDVINSSNSMITLGALIIASVTLGTIDPNQTQIDVTLCVVIILANLNAPLNLVGWLARRRKILFSKHQEKTPLIKRQQAHRERSSLAPDLLSPPSSFSPSPSPSFRTFFSSSPVSSPSRAPATPREMGGGDKGISAADLGNI